MGTQNKSEKPKIKSSFLSLLRSSPNSLFQRGVIIAESSTKKTQEKNLSPTPLEEDKKGQTHRHLPNRSKSESIVANYSYVSFPVPSGSPEIFLERSKSESAAILSYNSSSSPKEINKIKDPLSPHRVDSLVDAPIRELQKLSEQNISPLQLLEQGKADSKTTYVRLASIPQSAASMKLDQEYLEVLFNQNKYPLHFACSLGEVDKVEHMLASQKFKIDSKNDAKQAPLNIAVSSFNLPLVELLIAFKAKIETRCNDMTPLMQAVIYATKPEHVKLISFLLKSGANVNVMQRNGESSAKSLLNLFIQKSRNNIHDREILKLLIEHGLKDDIDDIQKVALKANNQFINSLIEEERNQLKQLREVAQMQLRLNNGKDFKRVNDRKEVKQVSFDWAICEACFTYTPPTRVKFPSGKIRSLDNFANGKRSVAELPSVVFGMPTVEQIKNVFLVDETIPLEIHDKVKALNSHKDILDFLNDTANIEKLKDTSVREFLELLQRRLTADTLPTIRPLTST